LKIRGDTCTLMLDPDAVQSAVNVIATCQRMPYGPQPDKLVKSIARVKS
jgi:hypothetical protein